MVSHGCRLGVPIGSIRDNLNIDLLNLGLYGGISVPKWYDDKGVLSGFSPRPSGRVGLS